MHALLTTWNGEKISTFDPDGTIEDLSDTPTLRAALTGPEKDQWVSAIHSELDNIKREDIYDLVNLELVKVD